MQRPLIIPIFITHQGCPHRCIFCNQQPITGTNEHTSINWSAEQVADEINHWLQRSPARGRETQVAFYGGSFTGLSLTRQQELLEAVQPFLTRNQVNSIRLSTRPDYIDHNTPKFLKGLGVNTVEIGVQSMDQGVLDASLRGHTVTQAEEAIVILKGAKMTVGAQLMIGLPTETTTSAIRGARHLSKLQPDFARLYPALVIKGSALAELYHQRRYHPMTLLRTIALTARLKEILNDAGIKVIRCGLQPSTELAENLEAGPHHPALGELVQSRIMFNKTRCILSQGKKTPLKRVQIAMADQSIFYGNKKCSLKRLTELGLLENVEIVFSSQQERGTIQQV